MGDTNYEDKNVDELRDLARQREVKGPSAMNKDALVSALQAKDREGANKTDEDPRDDTTGDAPNAGNADEGSRTIGDSVQETEANRVKDDKSALRGAAKKGPGGVEDGPVEHVGVGDVGPALPRSAPENPDAEMWSLNQKGH
jgi:hypothetical protein